MAYLDIVFLEDAAVLEKYSALFRQNFLSQKGPEGKRFKVAAKKDQNIPKGCFGIAVGGTLEANNFAVSNPKIDVLLSPVGFGKPEFDSGHASLAAQNKIIVAMDFSRFLGCTQKQRSMLFRNYQKVAKLCRKYGAFFCVFSCAKKEHELRQARDFSSLLCIFGFSQQEALQNVRNIGDFLEKRKKLEGFEVLE